MKVKKYKGFALLGLLAITATGCVQKEAVILATHDSFAISDDLLAEFEANSGFQLEILRLGDTGSLVSRLGLTSNAPIADAYYGIDSTFLEKAREAGLIEEAPIPVDFGDVCFNIDNNWFSDAGIEPPVHWSQLAEEEFAPLTVITDPRMSSPGLAFLLSTEQYFSSPSDLADFWSTFERNGVRVAASWEDAYYLDFTRYGGDRPIVLSYASSPAAEISEEGNAMTSALRDHCFRQIEFAGVLPKAENIAGARALLEFFQGDDFQRALPDSMFVYPVSEAVALDDIWEKAAPPAKSFFEVKDAQTATQQVLLDLWDSIFEK